MTKLKKKRIELGYKQYKIAEYLRISTRHYARAENGERQATYREIEALSKLFNCKPNEIEEEHKWKNI